MRSLRRGWGRELVARIMVCDAVILLLLLALAGLTFFWRLGQGSLYDWDEALHAQMAQEMVWARTPLTPQWAGKLRFTKPPLSYWQIIAAFQVFGANEFAARFPAAAAGVGAVLLTYLLGRELFNRAAGLGAALLLLIVRNAVFSHHYNLASIGRMAMMTTPLACCTLLTLWLAWRGERDHRYLAPLGIPLAAAIMLKSVAGLVPLAIVLVYWLVARPWRRWPWRALGLAAGLTVALALPWHLYAALWHGEEFWSRYVLYNLVQRVTQVIDSPQHARPLWYYLDIIRQGFSPGWPVLLAAIPYALHRAWHHGQRAWLLLLCAALVPLALYSPVRTKLPWYILDAYPALALLAAAFLVQLLRERAALVSIVAFMVIFGWRLPAPRDGDGDVRRTALALQQLAGPEDVVLVSGRAGIRPASLFYAGRPVRVAGYPAGSGAQFLLTDVDTWQEAGLAGEVICRSGAQLLVRAEPAP